MEMTNVGNLLELRRIYSRGITGKGITTAVLDTGIYAHPDFFIPQNKILYFQDFVRNRRGPFDDNGHGTHVSGIIASGGRFGDGSGIGVAPESSIVMLKVLERDGSGKIKNMIKGMEWICMNHKKYGIRIVNISVGMPVKNIENPAMEKIILLYAASKKQIFIAIDKIHSYDKVASSVVETHGVIQLSKDKTLFIKNWKNATT